MIRKKQAAVLLVVLFMVGSIAMVPFMVNPASVEPAASTSPDVTPTVEELKDNYVQRLMDNPSGDTRYDAILANYLDTGFLPDNVKTTDTGISALVYVDHAAVDAVRDLAKVRWIMDLGIMSVVLAEIDYNNIEAVIDMAGLNYVMTDVYYEPPAEEGAPIEEPIGLDNFAIRDIVGATEANALGYDGTGVTIAISDSGIDFSTPDLKDALAIDGLGRPMNYDPSGEGMNLMTIANSTNVENVTEWLAMGYLLTYEMDGSYYLNTTGWDPVCTNMPFGMYRNLMGLLPPYGGSNGFPVGYPAGGTVGFIGLYEDAWGIANVSEFIFNEMWNHWELPVPDGNNYTVGWVFSQRHMSYAKLFAPAVIQSASELTIDWDAAYAWSWMWNYILYYEVYELTDPAIRAYLSGMMDWSFVDDQSDGYIFTVDGTHAGPVLAADIDGDGYDDFGLGSLTWYYDDYDYYDDWFNYTLPGATEEYLWCGIQAEGLGFALMFNEYDATGGEHGTWCASAAAARGVYDHEVYSGVDPLNDTTYQLPGMAPDAKLFAIKRFSARGGSLGGLFGAEAFAAGFHMNTTGHWVYTNEHKADIVSMSWGYTAGSYVDMTYLSLFWDSLTIPGWFDSGYQGTLFFSSAGNAGADYLTSGPPASAASVISVGASMATHFYDPTYGPQMGMPNSNIHFSSNGPNWIGYAQPDIVAPGYRGVNTRQSHNIFLDIDYSYMWWQGTSLASPVAAGVAACVLEAMYVMGYTYDPIVLKSIILNTATDRGLDAFSEGHGLINGAAAIDAVINGNGVFGLSSDSWDNYMDAMQTNWDYWMPDWAPYDIDHPYDWYFMTPSSELDSIYFGFVQRGGTYTVDLDSYYANNMDGFAYADWEDIQPWYYTEMTTFVFNDTTYLYDDTGFDPAVERAGFFNMTDQLLDAGYDVAELAAFGTAEYASVFLTYDASHIGDIWCRLFYWKDDGPYDMADNGEMNFYNVFYTPWGEQITAGDSIEHIARDYNEHNCHWMRVGAPGGFDFSEWTPTLVVDDDNPGTYFEVTVTLWQKELVTPITVSGADNTTTFTLDVPADAEHGVHQGYVEFYDSATGYMHQVPYSYMVWADIDTAEGVEKVIVDGVGAEYTPYENGAVHSSIAAIGGAPQEQSGWRTFLINVPDQYPTYNATTLAFKVVWQNTGTIVDLALWNLRYSNLARTTDSGYAATDPTGDLQNLMIYEHGGLVNGTYMLSVRCGAINGTDVPEEIRLTVQSFEALPTPTLASTYTELGGGSGSFGTDDIITGDHITIDFTWSDISVGVLPEYAVTDMQIDFLSGLYYRGEGYVAEPDGDFWPPVLADTDTYIWETVDGIMAGDNVRVTLTMFHGGDPSFRVYEWNDANDDGLVDPAGELVGAPFLDIDAGGADFPESGSFIAPRDMSLAIIVYTWLWQYNPDVTYLLEVDTRSAQTFYYDADNAQFDMADFLANVNKDMNVYCSNDAGESWMAAFTNVSFINFFAPTCQLLTPNGGEDWSEGVHRLTFTGSDPNADDDLIFQIRFSLDNGVFWQVLRTGPMPYDAGNGWYYWDVDFDTILATDNGLFEVTAFDNNTYYAGSPAPLDPSYTVPTLWPALSSTDRSDDVLTFGAVTVPTTTTQPTTITSTTTSTTSTTSTTTTTTTPVGIDPLIIGLIGGIGVGVVVVLILFLVKKK